MPEAAALPSLPVGLRDRLSGMARPGQIVGSFVAVLALYCLYWLIAVPLIEPGIDAKSTARTPDAVVNATRQESTSRQREVSQHFPPGAWELDNPAIWESDQTRLVFKTLRPLKDGTVELRPCTLLYFPKGGGTAGAPTQPIVLRAVEGANVQFDEPIVLKSVDLGKRKLVGGQLIGPIQIYRNASRPGASDDLEITTRDIEMVNDRLQSPHPVQFRLGRSHGSGRDLQILLAPADGSPGKGAGKGGVQMLELRRDVKMQLELAGGPLTGGAAMKRSRPEPPLEITCQGPFQFETERNAASFHDFVNVFRPTATGESDQLTCEVLTVYFESPGGKSPAEQSAPSPASESQVSGVQVRLIEARGDPVTLRSPTRGMYAHCRGVDYLPAPAGATGALVALGPGFIQGNLPNDPEGKYDAKWSREFRFEPEGTQHRAAVIGEASVRFVQMGTITADEIFAWLTPKNPPAAAPAIPGATQIATENPNPNSPAAPAASPVAPGQAPPGPTEPMAGGWQLERLLARVYQDKKLRSVGDVVIASPQMHGVTGQLEAVVERPPALIGQTPAATTTLPTTAPAEPPPADPSPVVKSEAKPRPAKTPAQRFDVRGGQIHIQLVPNGDQLAVSSVTIEKQARLKELTPAQAGSKPLLVHGDRLHVTEANTEATRVTVSGRPGYLEDGGMTLEGSQIEMEKHTSRLWINGPGRMTMPVEQDLNGQPIAHPQPLTITWRGGMAFQGNSVVFQTDVVARTESQSLGTEKLEAVFSRPIDFSQPKPEQPGKPADKPELAHVRCFGRATLAGRQVDDRGQQTGVYELDALDLAVNKISGDVTARGPGSLTNVSRGSAQASLGGPGAAAKPRAATDSAGDGLTYLHVRFQTSLDGNLIHRVMRFREPSKAVYGPVDNWDAKLNPDNPASLGPRGLVLDSKQLEVREMPARVKRDRGWFELKAQGNVVAEGSQFTARGDQLTYSEEKDELVLRGDELTQAEFFQDDPADGSRRESRAHELRYWFTLQRVGVTSFQSFDMSMPKKTNPSKKKSAFQ
jgi:hypothetical protein